MEKPDKATDDRSGFRHPRASEPDGLGGVTKGRDAGGGINRRCLSPEPLSVVSLGLAIRSMQGGLRCPRL